MRTDLPALVVGCGPSAVHVPYAPDQYTVHAVNDAIRLCERVDTLAINDTPVLMRRTFAELREVGTLLLPEHLHDDVTPTKVTPSGDAVAELVKRYDAHLGCTLRTYRLHTDPVVMRGDKEPTFGRCRSTSDSLIAWLLQEGVREFMTTGIEYDGRDGWAQGLPRGVGKYPGHRRAIWQHTVERINAAGGTVRKWSR